MRFRIRLFQTKFLLCVSLFSAAAFSIAEEKSGYDLLLEMAIPKPHEVELARKGVAEASIEKAWERPCPYKALEAEDGSAEGDKLYYSCQRWNDCIEVGGSASVFTEAFFRNHKKKSGEIVIPWELMRDGSAFGMNESNFETTKGQLYRYALKFAEENWRLFEGRAPLEASDLVEKKFWQWCSIQPLSIWEDE
ncbi:hypothetical protein [Shewanella sp.]|uniref:hypothetical protein n=1 Tax=Shewanella sp. TaxID=50422 RepID=UPI00261606F5|nr:hypothetical protein [Shewanella sp.]